MTTFVFHSPLTPSFSPYHGTSTVSAFHLQPVLNDSAAVPGLLCDLNHHFLLFPTWHVSLLLTGLSLLPTAGPPCLPPHLPSLVPTHAFPISFLMHGCSPTPSCTTFTSPSQILTFLISLQDMFPFNISPTPPLPPHLLRHLLISFAALPLSVSPCSTMLLHGLSPPCALFLPPAPP